MAVVTEDVHGFVERGRQEGAEIVAGGEFFGPVGSASPFEDDKGAIRLLVSTSPNPFNPFGP